MVNTLEYIENQSYEGIQVAYTKKSDGSALDVSSLTECVVRVFKRDYSALEFSGSYTGGEVTFLTDGADGILIFTPQTDDMDEYGLFPGEVETTLGGKSLKKQNFLVDIKREAPIS